MHRLYKIFYYYIYAVALIAFIVSFFLLATQTEATNEIEEVNTENIENTSGEENSEEFDGSSEESVQENADEIGDDDNTAESDSGNDSSDEENPATGEVDDQTILEENIGDESLENSNSGEDTIGIEEENNDTGGNDTTGILLGGSNDTENPEDDTATEETENEEGGEIFITDDDDDTDDTCDHGQNDHTHDEECNDIPPQECDQGQIDHTHDEECNDIPLGDDDDISCDHDQLDHTHDEECNDIPPQECDHGQINHTHDEECNDIPLGDDDDDDDDDDVFRQGLITLSFDDGYKSIDDNIHLLNDYKSTQYIYSVGVIGATLGGGVFYTDFMTLADVADLYTAGHEISAHTRSHIDLTSVSSSDEKQFEIDGSRLDLLQEIGFPINNFAFPFGEYDTGVIGGVQSAGFVGSRTVDGSVLNTSVTDRYKLHAKQVLSTSTLAEVKGWIDEAVTSKKWLILVFHRIEDDCGADLYCVTPTMLSDIVEYLESREDDLEVITVGEGLALMDDHPTSDGSAPLISQSDITVPATSPSGAEAAFSPLVTDLDVGLPAPLLAMCTIPNTIPDPISGLTFPTVISSGHTFPIGTTTVTCTSADAGGNLGEMTFDVTVTDDGPGDDDDDDDTSECSDGIDNDDDGFVDYPDDVGCIDALDDDETDPAPQCSDGIDNDDDGSTDYPDDLGCSSSEDDDESDDPVGDDDDDDDDDGGGGGTTGGGIIGSGNILGSGTLQSVAPVGEVLGASTVCPDYIGTYMRYGQNNDPEQVMRLQEFLNQELKSGLIVNGVYDIPTVNAVKWFQLKYWREVLLPWVPYGFPDSHKASGWVYKTTLSHINRLLCPDFDIPTPVLP